MRTEITSQTEQITVKADRGWREWTENFQRVSSNPEAASEKDICRAIDYLDHARRQSIWVAQEDGRLVDPNVLDGYDSEFRYYKALLLAARPNAA